jgi:transcriptional regulator with XRE-family HTH domain
MSTDEVVPLRQPTPQPELRLRTAIGQALRDVRTEQGRTLSDVAEVAGMSMQYLSEVERGRKEASSEILEAVCTALNIRLADLVARTHRVLTVQTRSVAATPPRGPLLMAA